MTSTTTGTPSETVYECGGCGDEVPQRGGPPEILCLNCGADDWQEVDEDA